MQKRIILIVLGVMNNIQATDLVLLTGGNSGSSRSSGFPQHELVAVETLELNQVGQPPHVNTELRAQAHEQSKGEMKEAYFALCRAGQKYLTTFDPQTVKQAALKIGFGFLGAAAMAQLIKWRKDQFLAK